jgi:hypothetical protein
MKQLDVTKVRFVLLVFVLCTATLSFGQQTCETAKDEKIPYGKIDNCGCPTPPKAVFEKTELNIKLGDLSFGNFKTGGFDIKKVPNVIQVASKHVIDKQILDYTACRTAKMYGYNLAQRSWLDRFNVFFLSDPRPTPAQLLEFNKRDPFPTDIIRTEIARVRFRWDYEGRNGYRPTTNFEVSGIAYFTDGSSRTLESRTLSGDFGRGSVPRTYPNSKNWFFDIPVGEDISDVINSLVITINVSETAYDDANPAPEFKGSQSVTTSGLSGDRLRIELRGRNQNGDKMGLVGGWLSWNVELD